MASFNAAICENSLDVVTFFKQESTGVQGKLIQNWSQTFSCKPELYFEPKSVKEIQDILKTAKVNKKKIKIIGNAYSPSSIAMSNEYLVSLKHLDTVLDVWTKVIKWEFLVLFKLLFALFLQKIDVNKLQVKVEAGIALTKLNQILTDNQMAISSLGAISHQSIAGAMSCAMHGTGKHYGVFSSYVSGC
jgi:FAD/FMN-containing dehydrogenase